MSGLTIMTGYTETDFQILGTLNAAGAFSTRHVARLSGAFPWIKSRASQSRWVRNHLIMLGLRGLVLKIDQKPTMWTLTPAGAKALRVARHFQSKASLSPTPTTESAA